MIKGIHAKSVIVNIQPDRIMMPKELEEKINDYWENIAMKQTPGIWNGEIVCVTSLLEKGNTIDILCKKSNYAHYIYDERVGLPNEQGCYNISGGCLLETSDGYYVIGELDENTSYPFCLQIPGGNVDKKDGNDLLRTIKREVMEEINIDLENKKQVKKYELAWITIPTGKERCYEVFAKGILTMSKREMMGYFERYLKYLKENNLEVEFGKLHFLKKDKVIQQIDELNNPKREYLKPLLQFDRNYENELEI